MKTKQRHLNIESLLLTLAFTTLLHASTLSFPIVDTGQTDCYSNSELIEPPRTGEAFCGQDAQYLDHEPNYVDHGDGTVTDLVTGLMWQQTPSEKITFVEALAGAETFALAGYDDWRLPNIKELYSLILFSGIDPGLGATEADVQPFVDTAYFDFAYGDTSTGERMIDAQYWSATEYVWTTMNDAPTAFGVNFADGRIKGYGREDPRGQQMQQFVRYVRGRMDYGINQFVDNGNGTVTDLATGLMWMQADSEIDLNWEEALAYAEGLQYGEHDDWRLPDAKELQSIVDYTRSPDTTDSAAIDPVFQVSTLFNEAGRLDYPFYWSSTTHVSTAPGNAFTAAAYIAFGRAMGYMQNQWMDVHGAGAQRSDPKQGNPTAFLWGRGPQGDNIRIYNHVRCVRSAEPPQ